MKITYQHTKLGAGGKPSTWLPPGRLVEHFVSNDVGDTSFDVGLTSFGFGVGHTSFRFDGAVRGCRGREGLRTA